MEKLFNSIARHNVKFIQISNMEVANLLPVVDRLEDNIDDLEEALEPLLSRSLDETSKKLPLLERAKLHALLTYTLESLIFCMSDHSFFLGAIANWNSLSKPSRHQCQRTSRL